MKYVMGKTDACSTFFFNIGCNEHYVHVKGVTRFYISLWAQLFWKLKPYPERQLYLIILKQGQ